MSLRRGGLKGSNLIFLQECRPAGAKDIVHYIVAF